MQHYKRSTHTAHTSSMGEVSGIRCRATTRLRVAKQGGDRSTYKQTRVLRGKPKHTMRRCGSLFLARREHRRYLGLCKKRARLGRGFAPSACRHGPSSPLLLPPAAGARRAGGSHGSSHGSKLPCRRCRTSVSGRACLSHSHCRCSACHNVEALRLGICRCGHGAPGAHGAHCPNVGLVAGYDRTSSLACISWPRTRVALPSQNVGLLLGTLLPPGTLLPLESEVEDSLSAFLRRLEARPDSLACCCCDGPNVGCTGDAPETAAEAFNSTAGATGRSKGWLAVAPKQHGCKVRAPAKAGRRLAGFG